MLREYAKAAGWSSLALLAITAVTYSVRSAADWGLWLPLGLGLAAGIFWASQYHAEAVEVLTNRRARQGGMSAVYTLAVLTIVCLVQALVVANDQSIDLSKNKDFTLSDETVKAVKGLGDKVQFLAFYGNENRAAFEDLLKRVKKLNPSKVDYEFVNLNSKPLMAQEYGVRSLGTTVLVAGDKKETLAGTREEDLLNALLKVSSGEKKQVYFLTGHQERSVADAQADGASGLKTGLESASFGVQDLNLGSAPKGDVPADAAAVIIAGPRSDLVAPELDSLTRYLGRGGRVFAAVDPRTPVAGFKAWLAKAGVVVDDDIVIDPNPFNQLYGASAVAPFTQTFDPSHPVTKDLAEQHGQAIFPTTRTVNLGKLPDQATGTVLAHTQSPPMGMPQTAFGWTGSGDRAPSRPGAGDKRAPLDLMVAVEAPLKDFGGDAAAPPDKKARLVVLGTSVLLDNQGVGAFNNQDLVVNSLRWLADEEKKIALAPKPTTNEPLMLDAGRIQIIKWSFLLLALAALAGGIVVFRVRRTAA